MSKRLIVASVLAIIIVAFGFSFVTEADRTTKVFQITTGADDARDLGNTAYNDTVVAQYLGKFQTGADYHSGLRWSNITIPQGAHITLAILDLYSAGITAGTGPNVIWHGEANDNASEWSASNAPSKRSLTTAAVTKRFTASKWSELGFGKEQIDVTPIIQEIVSRPGWNSGNTLALLGKDGGSEPGNYVSFSTRDRASGRGAILHITYEVGSVPSGEIQQPINITSSPLSVQGDLDLSQETKTLSVTTKTSNDKKHRNTESSTAATSTSTLPTTTTPLPAPEPETLTSSGTWKAFAQAWIYPGAPACKAASEYSGRNIAVLKPEYFTVGSDGAIVLRTVETDGCNGYSSANAADIKLNSQEQYVTVSSGRANMQKMVSSTILRSSAIKTLTTFVQQEGFTGIELDFEGYGQWSATDYQNYKYFVNELGEALHAQGKKLMIDGPAIGTATEQNYYDWKYEDFAALPVDYILVMAYDYQYDYGAGSAISPNQWVQNIVQWTKAKIADDSKIIIGIPSYGYHGQTGGYTINIDTQTQSSSFNGFALAQRDPASHEMMWEQSGISYRYMDSEGLNKKRELIESLGIQNISVWHLGGNDWFSGKSER